MKRIGISVNGTSWDETSIIIIRCMIPFPRTNCFVNSCSCSSQAVFNSFLTTLVLQKLKKKKKKEDHIYSYWIKNIYNESFKIYKHILTIELTLTFRGLRGAPAMAGAGAGAGAGEICGVV